MQKHDHTSTPSFDPEYTGARILEAVEAVQSTAGHASTRAKHAVRQYPLMAVGLALGTGLALGIAGTKVLGPRRPPSLWERVGLAALMATAVSGVRRLF